MSCQIYNILRTRLPTYPNHSSQENAALTAANCILLKHGTRHCEYFSALLRVKKVFGFIQTTTIHKG